MNTLDGNAIKEVATLSAKGHDVKLRLFQLNDTRYLLNPDTHEVTPLGEVNAGPEPLQVHSLQALVDYLHSRVTADIAEEDQDLSALTLHVQSPTQVSLIGALRGTQNRRYTYAVATARERGTFRFGQWMSAEDAIIAIQASFVADANRAKLLAVIGNAVATAELKVKDDGVSQDLTVRANLSLAGREELPNPLELAPYRTFNELEQPISPFVVRARVEEQRDDKKVIRYALFEADGGAWQETAVARIKDFLIDGGVNGVEVDDVPVIG